MSTWVLLVYMTFGGWRGGMNVTAIEGFTTRQTCEAAIAVLHQDKCINAVCVEKK